MFSQALQRQMSLKYQSPTQVPNLSILSSDSMCSDKTADETVHSPELCSKRNGSPCQGDDATLSSH